MVLLHYYRLIFHQLKRLCKDVYHPISSVYCFCPSARSGRPYSSKKSPKSWRKIVLMAWFWVTNLLTPIMQEWMAHEWQLMMHRCFSLTSTRVNSVDSYIFGIALSLNMAKNQGIGLKTTVTHDLGKKRFFRFFWFL